MKIATYKEARDLKKSLAHFKIHVKVETFTMKTSGIFIPRWMGDTNIPHEWNATTETAKWFFFFRFHGHKDINVGEALDIVKKHGIRKLVHQIKHGHI